MEEAQDSLDKIFDGFVRTPSIFRKREALSSSFVPESLPHRTDQTNALGYTLASALKGGTPSNVFLYGKTGTGKTAVAKHVLERLSKKATEQGYPLRTCYLNCKTITAYRVYADLCNSLGVSVPMTGLPTNEVFTRLVSALDCQNTLLIVVLDEVDALVKKDGNETLYHLTRVNSNLKHARVSLIGISNDLMFKEFLHPRVLSSLSEEEIVFPPYSAPEISDILKERAEIGFHENTLESAVIPMIAAIAAKEHGDARRAIDLLRVAGEIAERNKTQVVTEEHLREAQCAIERNTVSEVIETLPLQGKLLLAAVLLQTQSQSRLENGRMTSGDVYNLYVDMCKEIGQDPLTARRIGDIVNELDMLGIIQARLTSRGRYGRTKVIRLSVPISLVKTALSKNRHTASFVGS